MILNTQKNKKMSKDTLQLPKTAFSMKASLPTKEPEILKKWEKNKIFEKLRKNSKGKEKFILHDGPPYANGHIHMGTALNKILKDIITRFHQMNGKSRNNIRKRKKIKMKFQLKILDKSVENLQKVGLMCI